MNKTLFLIGLILYIVSTEMRLQILYKDIKKIKKIKGLFE